MSDDRTALAAEVEEMEARVCAAASPIEAFGAETVRLLREREEARAEVERLAKELAEERAGWNSLCDDASRIEAELYALRAQLASVTAERDDAVESVRQLREDLLEEERRVGDADADRAIAEEVAAALYLAARAAGYEGGDHWEEGDGTRRGEEMLALVRTAARREGTEEMREVVKAEIHAAFHYKDPSTTAEEPIFAPCAGEWESHQTLRKLLPRVCSVLTEGEALRDPADIAIIGRVADALRALPLDAPSGQHGDAEGES